MRELRATVQDNQHRLSAVTASECDNSAHGAVLVDVLADDKAGDNCC